VLEFRLAKGNYQAIPRLISELVNLPVGRGGHLAWIILDEVRRATAAPFELPIPQDRRLERLTRALVQNPASPATIDEWAEGFRLSRRTLTRLFRSQTGLSFGT